MSKRNLVNLILFALTLALVAIVVVEPGKEQTKKPPTLTRLKAEEINSIKIHRLGLAETEQDIEFNKTAQGWKLVKPYSVAANSFRVEAILKLLSAPSLSQNDISQLDLDKFGLKKPLATLTFNDTKIEFGHNKSLKNHRYVKIGSTLYMINDTFYYQVNAKAESYIDHKLIAGNSDITKLQLPTMTLTQTDGKWAVKPEVNDISADAYTQLVNEWQLSQAYDVNIAKPQGQATADITINYANNKPSRFKIIASTDNFILFNLDSGISYVLSKDRQNKLLKLNDSETQD